MQLSLRGTSAVGMAAASAARAMQRADSPMPRSALKKPTISTLSDEDWLAVNTILDEMTVRAIIPRLKEAGAQGIVEYPLNKIVM